MGLNAESGTSFQMKAVILLLVVLAGCATKQEVKRNVDRFDCCNPGIDAVHKDICKWMHDKGITRAQDFSGNLYEGVWSDCEPGKEPWRKWE